MPTNFTFGSVIHAALAGEAVPERVEDGARCIYRGVGVIILARRGLSLFVMVSLAGLLLGGCDKEDNSSIVNFSGDAHRGASLISKYGCGGCHSIPDIANANGNVGPPLQHVGTRTYIAGLLNNSPDNMALWLQNPQKVLPGNAMPAMGISQQDSRDMTAFLYTLK